VSNKWRVTVRFRHEVDAERVRKELRDAGEVRAAGGSVWMPEGDAALCVYAPDSGATGPIAAAVRRGTDAAGVKPVSVRVDEWIPEERRWSDDRGTRRRTGGSGGMDPGEVINLIDVIHGLISWP
jgi:hypothetical protein